MNVTLYFGKPRAILAWEQKEGLGSSLSQSLHRMNRSGVLSSYNNNQKLIYPNKTPTQRPEGSTIFITGHFCDLIKH